MKSNKNEKIHHNILNNTLLVIIVFKFFLLTITRFVNFETLKKKELYEILKYLDILIID